MALSLQVLECQAPGGWLGVLLSSLCLGERLVKTFFDGQPRFEHPTWSGQSLLCPEPVLWSPCVCGISTWWRWEECGEGPLWANKVFWFSPLPSYKAIERKGFWQTSGKGQRTNLHEMMPKNLSLLQSSFHLACLLSSLTLPAQPLLCFFGCLIALLREQSTIPFSMCRWHCGSVTHCCQELPPALSGGQPASQRLSPPSPSAMIFPFPNYFLEVYFHLGAWCDQST